MNRIEQIIGEAILQDTTPINLRGVVYNIGKPSTATIIEASKYISRLSTIPPLVSDDEAIQFTFAHARDCEVLGDIVAILLLGKKNLFTTKRLFGVIPCWKINNVKRLAVVLLEDFSSEELSLLLADAIGSQRVAFFLRTITILNEANLLRKTKKEETIASGQ